jgi:MinD superfamily P-loop ATPase
LDLPYSNIASALRFTPDKTWKDWKGPEYPLFGQVSSVTDTIALMACPVAIQRKPFLPTEETIIEVIDMMKKTFGTVIIDCGAAVDEYVKIACQMADKILLVSTPDQISIRNSLMFLEFIRVRADIEWVINKAKGKLPFKPKELMLETGYPVVMVLPYSERVEQATLAGEFMVEKYKRHPWSKEIRFYAMKEKGEHISWLMKLLG